MDSGPAPDVAALWKEFGTRMRAVGSGHNSRNKSYMNYWDTAGAEGRWPPHRKLSAAPVAATTAPTTGKCPVKLVVVSGKKYGMRGGYSAIDPGNPILAFGHKWEELAAKQELV